MDSKKFLLQIYTLKVYARGRELISIRLVLKCGTKTYLVLGDENAKEQNQCRRF